MAQDQDALQGALRLTNLAEVLDRTVEHAYEDLQDLTTRLPNANDEERKRALVQHVHGTRQRLLRLLVLAQWSNKARAVVEAGRVLQVAAAHASAYRETADQLAFLHAELEGLRAPGHDVETALEVLRSGTYALLPASIQQLGAPPAPSSSRALLAARRLDHLVRRQLLADDLPVGLEVRAVERGAALLRHSGLYEVRATLAPAPDLSPTIEVLCQQQQGGGGGTGGGSGDGEAAAADGGAHEGSGGGGDGKAAAADRGAHEGGGGGGGKVEVGAEAAAAATASGSGGSKREAQWRWRLLSVDLLPGSQQGPALTPQQSHALLAEVERRMWASQDAALLAPYLPADEPPTTQQQQKSGAAATASAVLGQQQATQQSGSSRGAAPAGVSSAAAGAASTVAGGGEGDEPGTPSLVLMHRMLSSVAARVVLSRAYTEAQALLASDPYKGGSAVATGGGGAVGGGVRLRVGPGSVLRKSFRISYWQGTPLLTAPPPGVAPPAAGTARPPALELGMDASEQHLQAVHVPPLLPITPPQGGEQQQHEGGSGGGGNLSAARPYELHLEAGSVCVERLLMHAAAQCATVQLDAMRLQLERSPHMRTLGACCVLRSGSPQDSLGAAANGDMGSTMPPVPTLEVGFGLRPQQQPPSQQRQQEGEGAQEGPPPPPLPLGDDRDGGAAAAATSGAAVGGGGDDGGDGEVVLRIGLDLRTGRLVLAAGPMLGHLENCLQQVELRLEASRKEAAAMAAAQAAVAAASSTCAAATSAQQQQQLYHHHAGCLPVISSQIGKLFHELCNRRRLTHLGHQVWRHDLQLSTIPLPLVMSFFEANPGLRRLLPQPSRSMALALPPFPPAKGLVGSGLPVRMAGPGTTAAPSLMNGRELHWHGWVQFKLMTDNAGGAAGAAASAAAASSASGPAPNPRASASSGSHFVLLVAVCDRHGMPFQVIRCVEVPDALLLRQRQEEGERQQPQHKRKRDEDRMQQGVQQDMDGDGDDAGAPPPHKRPHTSSDTEKAQQQQQEAVNGLGGSSLKAPAAAAAEATGGSMRLVPCDSSSTAAAAAVDRRAAEYDAVVGWCMGQAVWQLLTIQLQALQIPYVLEIDTASSYGGADVAGLGASNGPGGQSEQRQRKQRTPVSAGTLHLSQFKASGPLQVRLAPCRPATKEGLWQMTVTGEALGSGAASSLAGHGPWEGTPVEDDDHDEDEGGMQGVGPNTQQQSQGVVGLWDASCCRHRLVLRYSCARGHGVLSALRDANRLQRLHTFAGRLRRAMASQAEAACGAKLGQQQQRNHHGQQRGEPPQQQQRQVKSEGGHDTANGLLSTTIKAEGQQLPNGMLQAAAPAAVAAVAAPHGVGGSSSTAARQWVVPGSGRVVMLDYDTAACGGSSSSSSVVLEVHPAAWRPPQRQQTDGGNAAAAKQEEGRQEAAALAGLAPPCWRLQFDWVPAAGGSSSSGGTDDSGDAAAAAPAAAAAALLPWRTAQELRSASLQYASVTCRARLLSLPPSPASHSGAASLLSPPLGAGPTGGDNGGDVVSRVGGGGKSQGSLLPESALRLWGEMAHDCEEPLLLDSLAVSLVPLAGVASALQPHRVAASGMPPGCVELVPAGEGWGPFRTAVVVHKLRGRATISLHFYAGGLTWLEASSASGNLPPWPSAAAAAGHAWGGSSPPGAAQQQQRPQQQQQLNLQWPALRDRLLSQPGVMPPAQQQQQRHGAKAGSGGGGGPQGVWVRSSCVEQAIGCVLTHLATV